MTFTELPVIRPAATWHQAGRNHDHAELALQHAE